MKFKQLSYEEMFVIEKMFEKGVGIREIGDFLGRSPNTVSYEIKEKSVNGIYTAEKAWVKKLQKRWKAKTQCLKVSLDSFLTKFVEAKLEEKWSPKQISGYLRQELHIICSSKAIYKFAESRGLNYLLFWGWNNHKGGRKRSHPKTIHDGRKYIEKRPERTETGHYEIDFIVSKTSTWVLLVVVDWFTKRTWVFKLPNRKRSTIREALSRLFNGVTVKSITTDNDIAFTCWAELEVMLNTHIYFTHPYHSWEKGLVENTNRWIRCFVPKRRDIGTVTQEELDEIHFFLNDRPRECIEFRTASSYYYQQSNLVLIEG